MFIGHFGAGFASKSVSRQCSLGTLFMAAQFIDLIWPILLLLGIERVEIDPGNTAFTPLNFVYYPFTHSLFGVLIWAVLFGAVYFAFRKNVRNALLLAGLVLSHWLLDLIVHRPDLPIIPWSEFKVGFDLWQSIALTLLVEGMIFAAGVLIYMRTTRAKDRVGSFGLWGLLVFLVVVYLLSAFGPPPDAVRPIAVVGLFQWLLVAWAYWVDRHRSPAAGDSRSTESVSVVG
jgi:membrane-bound metal-dependent hydrolase YbcI (DUF457 family)